MSTKRLAIGLVLCALSMTAGHASAQATKGAFAFDMGSLNAFAAAGTQQVFVFAQRSQSPSGTSGFAVLNVFDSSTFTFSQCVAADFDLSINPARSTLSFTTTANGFNCASGQHVDVACEPGPQSGILRSVTNGTADLRVFDQRYTTHGMSDTYNSMDCVLTALGGQFTITSGGSASSMRNLTTP